MAKRKPKVLRKRLESNCNTLRRAKWNKMKPHKRAKCMRLCLKNPTMGELYDEGC